MRRRQQDVFEFGEEQLLDEPAVELMDAGEPLASPPPGGGSHDEADGSGEWPGGAGGVREVEPRAHRLAAKRTTAFAAMAVALAAVAIGIRVVSDGTPGPEVESMAEPLQMTVDPGRGTAVADRAGVRPSAQSRRSSLRRPRQERAGDARDSSERNGRSERDGHPAPAPATSVPASPPPAPSGITSPITSPAPAPAPSVEPPTPSNAGPAVIEREFGP